MFWWNIYYRDREFAKTMDDPILATIYAETKEEAEKVANRQGIGGIQDVWAVKDK